MEQSKPHILLLIEGTYPWYRGGVSEWIFQYLSAFKDIKFSILQIATTEYIKLSHSDAVYEVPQNVECFNRIWPPNFGLNSKEDVDLWWRATMNTLSSKKNYFDLIHVTNTGFAGWAGKELAEKLNVPLILTEHALYWKEIEAGAAALECGYKITRNQARAAEIFKDLAREIYQQAEYVISVSKTNLTEQKRLGVLKPIYIPNGVQYNSFVDENKSSSVLTIGWVGRCASIKNPLKFLDFAEILYDKAKVDINIVMVTCNSNESQLNRLVKKRAKRLSFVDVIWDEPAIDYIAKMDMMCLTSINESQPLVLFEALSKKVLPIGWQTGDFTTEFGLAVPFDTKPEILAEKILNIWSDEEAFQTLINEKYEIAKLNHNWSVIFDQYRKLIDSAVYTHNFYEKQLT